jgi:hypothetical protein
MLGGRRTAAIGVDVIVFVTRWDSPTECLEHRGLAV